MSVPSDRDAVYQAINAGDMDLDDLGEVIAGWTPQQCYRLVIERLLKASAPGWINLCARQAQKPLVSWGAWREDPAGPGGLLGLYQQLSSSGSDGQTWPLSWLQGVLCAARAAARLREDLAAQGRYPEALDDRPSESYQAIGLGPNDSLWDSVHGLAREFLAGREGRQAQSTERMVALGVVGERGYAYDLRIDLLPEGSGRLYPIPVLTLPKQDKNFIDGLSEVKSYLTHVGLWPQDHDLRWSLKRIDGVPSERFPGASASVACALTIGRLMVDQGRSLPTDLQGLKALDLKGVAASAEISEAGQLRPVGGVWEKASDGVLQSLLLPGTDAVKRLIVHRAIHTLAVAEAQAIPNPIAESPQLECLHAQDLGELIRTLNATVRRSVERWQRTQAPLEVLGEVPLAWDRHYQESRLFRIEPEKPEQDDREGEPAGPAQGDAPVSLQRHEEAQIRPRRTEMQPRALAELLPLTGGQEMESRLLLRAPPGGGKTTFCRYLTHWVPAHGRPWLVLVVELADWQLWLDGQQRVSPPLEAHESLRQLPIYLAARSWEAMLPGTEWAQWKRRITGWLETGQLMVVFDGLDELDRGNIKLLTEALNNTKWSGCPMWVTCRTLSEAHRRQLGKDIPEYVLGELTPEQWRRYVDAYPGQYLDRERFAGHLRDSRTLQWLVSTPLLLSMLCFLEDDPDEGLCPAPTRGELFRGVVERMLERRRGDVRYPFGSDPETEKKQRWVARVALELLVRHGREQRFTLTSFQQGVRPAIEADGHANWGDWAFALMRDLEGGGLLRRGRRPRSLNKLTASAETCFFVHPNFQEFLAAQALADHLDDRGWDGDLPLAALGDKTCTARAFVSAKAWDPGWSEVIILLGGLLEDPSQLLEMLLDKTQDDILRHRLALAPETVAEIPEAKRKEYPELIDRVTGAAFAYGWQYLGTQESWPNIHLRGLPSLVQVNGKYQKQPLRNWLVGRLSQTQYRKVGSPPIPVPDESMPQKTARVLSLAGAAAAHDSILDVLAACLSPSHNPPLRMVAATALGSMGAAAATTGVLKDLVACLSLYESWNMRMNAARSLGLMGASAARKGILEALIKSQYCSVGLDTRVHYAVGDALHAIGSAAPKAVLDILLAFLSREYDIGFRREAAAWLRSLRLLETGTALEQNDVTEDLRAYQSLDEDDVERELVPKLLGEMDVTQRDTSKTMKDKPDLKPLVDRNSNSESHYLGASAARALGSRGEAAATVAVLEALVEQLGDADEDVRWEALEALGRMGEAAATAAVLEALVGRLGDADAYVQRAAASVLGGMGEAAATAAVLEALVERLGTEKDAPDLLVTLVPLADAPALAAFEGALSGVSVSSIEPFAEHLAETGFRLRRTESGWSVQRVGQLARCPVE